MRIKRLFKKGNGLSPKPRGGFMKAYLISDNMDTLVGMQYAGIDGIVAYNKDDALLLLDKLSKDENIGLIILTEKVGKLAEKKVNKIKMCKKLPLIIEIPDRFGSIKDEDYIVKNIKKAVGVKI